MPTGTNFGVITLIAVLAALATVAVYHGTNSTLKTASFKLGDVNHPHFLNWKNENNHTFGGAENLLRAKVFGENYNMIEAHNANESNTWTMKLGPFAHLTNEEFKALYFGLNVPENYTRPATVPTQPAGALLGGIDWTGRGAVTRVKNQAQCGSCWTFSVTGSLEGLSAVSGRGLPEFSEQQLVDCARPYGPQGCSGGWMTDAFHYVRDHGITYEGSYPYVGHEQGCYRGDGEFRIGGWVEVPAGNADALRDQLYGRPISVALDAGEFQHYGGGIMNNCGHNINHAVLLVGYDGNWKVKNSWGEGWGEGGYIRLAYGNTCAIADKASFPVG